MHSFSIKNIIKRTVVIGTTRLCISILEKLTEKGWEVLTVVSDDDSVRQFCFERKLKLVSSLEQVKETDFVLFSVANYTIIQEEYLRKRNVSLAINYHDSLLPKYAGVNSTTWAVYNQEETHGVSWHFITSGIDEGGIIKQASVPISSDETAFSLNIKIFEVAIKTFVSLLEDFETGSLTVVDQDKAQKTYFGKEFIPFNYGLIDFNDPYEKVDRLKRSLYFGDYPNAISTVKVWDGKKYYLAESITFLPKENSLPGQVYAASETNVQIGIQDGILIIESLLTLDGQKVLLENTHFQVGQRIQSSILDIQELGILSTMKKEESKVLKAFHSESSSFFSKTLSKENQEKLLKSVPFAHSKRKEILPKLLLILLKFVHQEVCIPIRYTTPHQKSKFLNDFLNHESFIYLNPDQQLLSFGSFAEKIQGSFKYLIPKDFFYRYHLQQDRLDVLVLDGITSSDSARLKITILENEVLFEGYEQDKMWIDSISSCAAFIFESVEISLDKPISSTSILSPKEAHKILIEWNQTEKQVPSHQTLHALFEAQVLKTPDEIAVVHNEKALTFSELNKKANQLARWIRSEYKKVTQESLKPNTPIPICIDRSLEMVIGLLGILKAGGAYVPIEPDYPTDRIAYILKDSSAKLLLGGEKVGFSHRLPMDEKYYNSYEDDNLEVFSQPQDLAYIIYTSGTTGNPKGVLIQHASAVNTLWALEEVYDFGPGHKKSGCFCSYVFDVSVTEIFSCLLRGGELHLFDNQLKYSPELLSEYIQENRINYIYLPPALLSLLPKKNYPSLQAVIFAGEPCDQKVGAYWASQLKLYNYYGPTECAVYATGKLAHVRNVNEIGRPIANKKAYVLDSFLNPVPIGAVGELYIGGVGQALGYLNLPHLTQEKFITNPYQTNERMYKTGDLVRLLPDGDIEYIGRNDFQVKIRGFRVEVGEIEKILSQHPKIKQSVVLVKEVEGQKSLIGFYLTDEELDPADIVLYLKSKLPDYMVPSELIKLDKFPTTFTGKLDRAYLLNLKGKIANRSIALPVSEIEKALHALWSEVLKNDQIGLDDVFFNVGGNSLLAIVLLSKVNALYHLNLPILAFFQYPTIRALAAFISGQKGPSQQEKTTNISSHQFAIIGMACRVPGANNIREFWKNLTGGVESIQEVQGKQEEGWVNRAANIHETYGFDAKFFGFTPREAESMDPQHRHFMEVVFEALEDSGFTGGEQVGLYGGQGENTYYHHHIIGNRELENDLGEYQIRINNDKDFLTTKISYRLNLTGPSLNIQTACSTSLVAVHVAITQLIAGECDVAVAGGVSIEERSGYKYKKGMIESADGRCRSFDKNSDGTVISSGVGAIVIKPLEKALADGNHIYAVIKGSSINNDGGSVSKAGYTAPSVQGQAQVIRRALKKAEVDPWSISYIETHGTGTKIGDPIEIAALHQVFSKEQKGEKKIAIGSVKSNLGHTDAAAGIIGLIKTALALKHQQIPPSLHFQEWNPEIERFNQIFYVNKTLCPWTNDSETLRRAGVSSLGIGGTNAHVILEEAPLIEKKVNVDKPYLCAASAETESSLNNYLTKLQTHFKEENELNLTDVAYTLQEGRKHFKYRTYFVSDDLKEPIVSAPIRLSSTKDPIFLFSGQGSQYVNMASDIYRLEPVFAQIVDQGCQLLKEKLSIDLFPVIFANPLDTKAAETLKQTKYAQPALFIIEFAMSKLLMYFGIQPKALIGHSVGEYVAAAISGTFSWEDALILVALRGQLMQQAEPGSMLSVQISQEDLLKILPSKLDLAVVNGPKLCVVAGPISEIASFAALLTAKKIEHMPIHTSHAFHSRMMQPILEEFERAAAKIKKGSSQIPILSNMTSTWLTDEEAKSSSYWRDHIRNPVLFYQGIKKIVEEIKSPLFVEVGPGRTLASLVKQIHPVSNAVHTVRHPKQKESDYLVFLQGLGELWQHGIELDGKALHRGGRLVSLPTYAFDHKEYSLERKKSVEQKVESPEKIAIEEDPFAPLKEIWKSVLGISLIRSSDHFFELGGHSLLATQLIRRIHETLKIGLEIREVFENPTLEGMHRYIHEKISVSPLSAQQKSLWVIQKIQGEGFIAYNEPLLFEVQGSLSLSILEQSLQWLVDRHEILKSYFRSDAEGNLFLQIGTGKVDIAIGTDLLQEISKPFDLTKSPLFRVRYFKQSKDLHQVLFVFHHLITDGASLRNFVQELSVVYNAYLENQAPQLPPLKSQYRDYVKWQNEFLKSESYQKKMAYWKTNLANCQELNLTQNKPRKNVFSFQGDKHYFCFCSELTQKLTNFAKQEKTTLFNLFLTGMSILLGRYCRQDDILVGAPMLNRPELEFIPSLGFFTNTVVLRNQIRGDVSFKELLRNVSLNTLSAYENQEVPFDHLVSELHIERDASRNPLVQVLLLLVNKSSHPQLKINNLKTRQIEPPAHPISKMDLTLGVFEKEDTIEGYYEYSTDIFQKEMIDQFAKNLQSLLEKAILDPDTPLKTLPLLDKSDEKKLVSDWNPEYKPRNIPGALHERFMQTALKWPNKIALKYGDQSLTYEELNVRSNQLAHYILSRKGSLPNNTLIAICVEPSFHTIISMLAVLKAGAAYVPIDPKYPTGRIEHIVSDSNAILVLVQKELHAKIPSLTALPVDRVVLIDDEKVQKEISESPKTDLSLPYSEQDLAYVIYTSGSTGKPKGVLIPHSNVLDLLYSGQSHYHFHENDVWVLFHSFAFDVSVWEVWGTFLYGGKLVIVSYETTRDPHTFYEITKREKITVLNQTPSAFRNYIDADVLAKEKIQTLRYVIFAGEALDIEMLRDWWRSHDDQHPLLVNMYGITEITVHASYQALSFSDLANARHGRVGVPLNHLVMYVLDDQRGLAPIGVPGELYVGGTGVACGYLNRDDLTRERYIQNPFIPGGRLYKSGDVARWMPDGTLEYIGRSDFQIKLRGFRIELGEIESVLMKYPGIKQVVVIVREEQNQKYLACYFTLSNQENLIDLAKLRNYLGESLPEYMTPSAFVKLEKIPLTVNGKVDRALLPKPDMSVMGGLYTPPSNPLEQKIQTIWSELLNIDPEKISVTANYFQLGGNSLSIIRMISKVRAYTGIDIPLSLFWKNPTIRMIGKMIEGKEDSSYLDKMKKAILQDLILPDTIQPLKKINPAIFQPKTVLVTGVTGFLGSYLVNELAKRKDLEIYCLIRANSRSQAKDRLFQAFKENQMDHLCGCENIQVVLGDLSLNRLGLSEGDYTLLAESIDVIYHNGALVHHLFDYERMRAANVFSTHALIQLAVTGKNKALHYISTIGVKHFDIHQKLKKEGEKWSFLEMNGYILTKWVSEQLILEAVKRGIHARIYRPGNITGSLKTGHCHPNSNYTLLKIKGFIQLKQAFYPENETFEMVPVDLLAKEIVEKSLESQKKTILNLDNPKKIPFSSYVERYINSHYPIQRVSSLSQWQKLLSTITEENALYPLKAFYDHYEEASSNEPSDLSFENLDYEEMIQKQIRFLQETRFII